MPQFIQSHKGFLYSVDDAGGGGIDPDETDDIPEPDETTEGTPPVEPEVEPEPDFNPDANPIDEAKALELATRLGWKAPEKAAEPPPEEKKIADVTDYIGKATAELEAAGYETESPEALRWIQNRAYDISNDAREQRNVAATFQQQRPAVLNAVHSELKRDFADLDEADTLEIAKDMSEFIMQAGPSALDYGQFETDPKVKEPKAKAASNIAEFARTYALGKQYARERAAGKSEAAKDQELEVRGTTPSKPAPVSTRPAEVNGSASALMKSLRPSDQEFVRTYAAHQKVGKIDRAFIQSLIDDGTIIPVTAGRN